MGLIRVQHITAAACSPDERGGDVTEDETLREKRNAGAPIRVGDAIVRSFNISAAMGG